MEGGKGAGLGWRRGGENLSSKREDVLAKRIAHVDLMGGGEYRHSGRSRTVSSLDAKIGLRLAKYRGGKVNALYPAKGGEGVGFGLGGNQVTQSLGKGSL